MVGQQMGVEAGGVLSLLDPRQLADYRTDMVVGAYARDGLRDSRSGEAVVADMNRLTTSIEEAGRVVVAINVGATVLRGGYPVGDWAHLHGVRDRSVPAHFITSAALRESF